jgi:hypothetical protein
MSESDPRGASIELQDQMSRNDYTLSLKKNEDRLQTWIKSSSFQLTICILSILAFICNQVLIYFVLFRDDILLTEYFARSLPTDDLVWTVFASLSLSIEIIFFFETVLRFIFVKELSKDVFYVIEGILLIFYLVPRLLLPLRISLIFDLTILFRCWRIKKIFENEISFERDLLYFTSFNMVKEKDQLESLYMDKLYKVQSELDSANLKLEKLLGYVVISDRVE